MQDTVGRLTTPEFALIATCARWPWTPALSAKAREQAAKVQDWPRFLALVDQQRVAGLISNAIKEAGVVLPADIAAEITERARENGLQEIIFVSETVRLTKLLQQAGLTVTVLKGASIAMKIFGRFGVRYSMDIDLMVAKTDVAAASDILLRAGYVRVEPEPDASAKTMRARLSRYKDMVFEHPGNGSLIELHWRLFQNPFLLRGAERAHTVPLTLSGTTVQILPDGLFELYLCAHGAEHAWARLKWLADLGALIGQGQSDAETLYAQARRRGLKRLVGPGLLLCRDLFETPVPAAVEREVLKDWRMRWLYRTAWSSMIGDEDGAELEDRSLATARKNLGHYLSSNDPRYWLSELRYDLLDTSSSSEGGLKRVLMLTKRLFSLGRSTAPIEAKS